MNARDKNFTQLDVDERIALLLVTNNDNDKILMVEDIAKEDLTKQQIRRLVMNNEGTNLTEKELDEILLTRKLADEIRCSSHNYYKELETNNPLLFKALSEKQPGYVTKRIEETTRQTA